MIVSVTERASYKRCKRQWHLSSRNRLNLQPMVPATALALGTFVHSALGAWLVDSSKPPKHTFLEAARDDRAKIIKTYAEQNPGLSLDEAKLARIDEATILGYSMMENYELHWKTPLPDDLEVVAQEQRLHIAIPGTEHTEEWVYEDHPAPEYRNVNHKGMHLVKYDEPKFHYLQGRLDGIVKKGSRLYVLEHKTYGARPDERVLRSTDQFVAYQWLLSQMDLGYDVAGVAYDGLWKRAAPPKKVDNREGKLSDLFCRLRIEHSHDVLSEFETMLAAEVNEMANNPHPYTNRTSDGSCFWGCSFESLCSAMTHGEDTNYMRKTEYTNKPEYDEIELENAS